jgi:serine/threonine-protein kinase
MSGTPRKPDLSETSPMDPPGSGGAAGTGGGRSSAGRGDDRAGELGGSGITGGGRGDTQPMPTPSPGQSSAGIDPKEKTRSGSNIDTIMARIVVDQGLATPEEVQQCLEQQRAMVEEANQQSLTDLLVNNAYITQRQARRIKDFAEAERSGQQIPGYKVLGKLGAGAMATVYKAKQLSLDRLVAIKVLPKKYNANTQFIERFYAEGRAAAQLNHPNIVQAYDVGKAGDFHYFVMEYVDGRTVYDDIVKHKRYAQKDALDIIIQVAEALQHAHAKGLIHRDVKPKNIMITKEGVAKLADMGLARAISDKEAAEAEQGKAFGTPYYISPEQIRGELKIGPPADIYSLGATLYHMVVGSVPFDGKNPSAVMHKHLKAELVAPDHVRPDLSAGIAEVIEMMMAKDPKQRHQGCKDLLVDLRAVREGKDPPIAHKDIAGAELATLAQAEAAAPAELVEDRSTPVKSVSFMLFVAVCLLLVLSVVFNIFLGIKAAM